MDESEQNEAKEQLMLSLTEVSKAFQCFLV
jgi:hypothetical protein